jgi:hypothetical protein
LARPSELPGKVGRGCGLAGRDAVFAYLYVRANHAELKQKTVRESNPGDFAVPENRKGQSEKAASVTS